MIWFIIFLFLAFPLIRALFSKTTSTEKNQAYAVAEVVEKTCPPHKWFSQEIRDNQGNRIYDRMVCKICGPLKSRQDIEREEP